MTSAWTQTHVAGIARRPKPPIPLVSTHQSQALFAGQYLWDMWPIQDRDGRVADISDSEYWMALSAPNRKDPALRHFEAKIRLLRRYGGEWSDLGNLLPDFSVPYEREWAGSAVLDGDQITIYFTGAGASEKPGGYQQELYQSVGQILPDGSIGRWSKPRRSVTNDGKYYVPANGHHGEPGKITAFRDPAYFRDPADGEQYLIFTASLQHASSDYNGAVGIANLAEDGNWNLLPALLHSEGVNNELERAHMVSHNGLYYLFWSTQAATFHPDIEAGPTGLYGMVAKSLFGPYEPLNETGLVLANPDNEPSQTYSWFVTADLQICSFIDHWGLAGRNIAEDPGLAAETFGGVPAPLLTISLDGNSTSLIQCDTTG